LTEKALLSARRDSAMMAGSCEITALRPGYAGFKREPIVSWTAQTTVERHNDAISAARRLAMRDMAEEIERSVHQAYEILLLKGPHGVLDRPNEQGLKRIFLRRSENPDAWRVMAREWRQEGGLSLPLVARLPLCGARCDADVQRRLPETEQP